jgi:hypothetical protein
LAILSLRLAFGLLAPPVQPITDEIQTYLLGLKYYATGAWPYYGNDVIAPPYNVDLLTQDPGALESLTIGLPLKIWPSPLAPFILLNLFSMAGLSLLAWYCSKRLPKLSSSFIFTWVLTAPWCVHYSTSMINLSFSMAISAFFFVAWMESVPSFSLGWIPLPLANATMGFFFSAWIQFHRTWVLLGPFLALSFFLQWKKSKKISGVFYFVLGALPLSLLILPTLFQSDYHFSRDVSGLSYGFNFHNFSMFPVTLAQFLALAGFEAPRFIGDHTDERFQFLLHHYLLVPGLFLWYFGILQPLIFIGFLFDSKNPHSEWKLIRRLLIGTFLLVYSSLLFTIKNPDINTFCEMLPVVMIYSLYVWERWWSKPWGKRFLQIFILLVLIFQVGYLAARAPQKQSLYLMYGTAISQAIDQHNYHLLGERRPGALY